MVTEIVSCTLFVGWQGGDLKVQGYGVIGASQFDLLIITGDVSDNGYTEGRKKMFAKLSATLKCFKVPHHIVFGNHDVGNKGDRINLFCIEYLWRWKDTFGSDRLCE